MNHKIDKLFKDKLAMRQAPPPPAAWERLQGQLQEKKQNKFVFWYKIAAVIILLFCSFLAVFQFQRGGAATYQQANDMTNILNELPEPENVLAKVETLAGKSLDDKDVVPVKEGFAAGGNQSEIQAVKTSVPEKFPKNELAESVVSPIEPDLKPENMVAEMTVAKELVEKSSGNKGVTIIYKKSANTHAIAAASHEEKDSGLKKFLRFAKEVKNADISLAELRDTKEDIFALEVAKTSRSQPR